jgi:transcriptional regulator with XRE-family HTH domain
MATCELTGRNLQRWRKRLGIKSSDLAHYMSVTVDVLNKVENQQPYTGTRAILERADRALTWFDSADIQALMRDYKEAEAYNNPLSDYEYEYGAEVAEQMRNAINAHHRILQHLKTIKEPPMGEQLYTVTFENGATQQEYGKSEEDVRDFIARCFKFKGPIKSVALYQPE